MVIANESELSAFADQEADDEYKTVRLWSYDYIEIQ